MECKLKIVPSYHRRILDLEGLLESKEPITLILQRTKLRLKGINEEYFFFCHFHYGMYCLSSVIQKSWKVRQRTEAK